VRYWGATGVGNFAKEATGVPEVPEAMKKALSDPAPAVRIAAARALCRMGQAGEGLPVLTRELSGDNLWARLEAANAFYELDEIARPALPELQRVIADQPGNDPPPARPKAAVVQLLNMLVDKLPAEPRSR
jgi:HEAT repeat protein